MSGFSAVLDQPCYVRSSSMPSASHPIVLKAEDELHKLKNCVSSSSLSVQMMCNGLKGLGDLYDCINELLCLPSNQQVLSYSLQKKWIEEELDGSIILLDLCRAMRDSLATTKEHVQDLRSALRRRGGKVIKGKVHGYISSRQKANKDIKNCLRSLKKMAGKCGCPSDITKDCNLSLVVRLFMEAREVAISLLQSLLSFLSASRPAAKTSRWSFVSTTSHKRKVACEGENEDTGDVRSMGGSCYDSYECISCEDVDEERVLKAQNQLQTLEINIEGLENGLECLFRQIIQSRVSLLNILSL